MHSGGMSSVGRSIGNCDWRLVGDRVCRYANLAKHMPRWLARIWGVKGAGHSWYFSIFPAGLTRQTGMCWSVCLIGQVTRMHPSMVPTDIAYTPLCCLTAWRGAFARRIWDGAHCSLLSFICPRKWDGGYLNAASSYLAATVQQLNITNKIEKTSGPTRTGIRDALEYDCGKRGNPKKYEILEEWYSGLAGNLNTKDQCLYNARASTTLLARILETRYFMICLKTYTRLDIGNQINGRILNGTPIFTSTHSRSLINNLALPWRSISTTFRKNKNSKKG